MHNIYRYIFFMFCAEWNDVKTWAQLPYTIKLIFIAIWIFYIGWFKTNSSQYWSSILYDGDDFSSNERKKRNVIKFRSFSISWYSFIYVYAYTHVYVMFLSVWLIFCVFDGGIFLVDRFCFLIITISDDSLHATYFNKTNSKDYT